MIDSFFEWLPDLDGKTAIIIVCCILAVGFALDLVWPDRR